MAHLDQLHPRVALIDVATGMPTRFFLRWLTQLYERTGGPDDAIEQVEIGELYETGAVDSRLTELQKQVEELETETDLGQSNYVDQLLFKAKEIAATYSTKENEIIICTAAVTITLNTKAKIGERVYIKRTNGKVTIVGTIDNKTNLILVSDNSSVTLLYTASGWWIL